MSDYRIHQASNRLKSNTQGRTNKMKGQITNFIGLVSLIAATAATSLAQESQAGGGGRLAGTWDAVVTIRDCATGNPLASFPSIANFNQGGTSIGSTGGIPQSLRTPEHGVWRHEKGNTYRFKFKTFRFLPTGVPNGWSIVEHELELSHDNTSYTSAGTARHFTPTGLPDGQGCSSAVGTRFEL